MKTGGLYLAIGDSVTWTIPGVTGEKGSDLYASRVRQAINDLYEPIRHINKGIGATRTDKILQNRNWLSRLKPDLLTIGVGMNDSANQLIPVSNYKNNLIEIIDIYRQQNPDVHIILCTPNTSTDPTRSSLPNYRLALEEVSTIKGVDIAHFENGWADVEMATYSGDGSVHPNVEGHRLLFEILFPIIRKGSWLSAKPIKSFNLPNGVVKELTYANKGVQLSTSNSIEIPLEFNANSDFTLYLAARMDSPPAVDETLWSIGSSSSNTPYMSINIKATGQVSFIARNDANEIGMTAQISTVLPKKQNLLFELKRTGTTITITDLSTGLTQSNTLVGTFTLNKQTIGALGRITNSAFRNGLFNSYLAFNRSINYSEGQQVRDYLKSKLISQDVFIH